MKIKSIIVIGISFYISGCATNIKELKGDYQSIHVHLSSGKKKSYNLISSSTGYVSSAIPTEAGILTFYLEKNDRLANSCFSIIDTSSNKVIKPTEYSGNKDFSFKNKIYSKYNELKDSHESVDNKYTSIKNSLLQNPAYESGTCVRPDEAEIPEKPCDPNVVTKQLSVAYCAVSNIRQEDACTQISSQGFSAKLDNAITSLLENPACDQLASALLNEDMTDAHGENIISNENGLVNVVDAAANAGVGAGVEMMLSGIGFVPGLLTTLASGSVMLFNSSYSLNQKANKFSACVNDVYQGCINKYNSWVSTVNEIHQMPDLMLKSCKDEIWQMEAYEKSVSSLEEDIRNIKYRSSSLLTESCDI